MRVERLQSRLFVLIVSTVCTLAAAEVIARVHLLYFASDPYFRKYASLQQLDERRREELPLYSPHRYLGYYPTPGYRQGPYSHNSLGFRGDEFSRQKPAGVFRIACLGASTTLSKVRHNAKTYPHLLQETLRQRGYPQVEVVNAGASNYTSWETLLNLELRVLELDPDLIIVYHGHSDIDARLVWPPDAYRADGSGDRGSSGRPGAMLPLVHHSTFLRALLIRRGFIEPHSSLDWQWSKRSPTSYARAYVQQKRLGVYPTGIFEEASAERMMDANPPRYFEANLSNMIAIARKNDVEVVVATFAYSPVFQESPWISTEVYRRGYAEHQEVVRGLAAEAHVFDFAKLMPTDRKYFSDGLHYTALGNQLRADLYADYLIGNDLIH